MEDGGVPSWSRHSHYTTSSILQSPGASQLRRGGGGLGGSEPEVEDGEEEEPAEDVYRITWGPSTESILASLGALKDFKPPSLPVQSLAGKRSSGLAGLGSPTRPGSATATTGSSSLSTGSGSTAATKTAEQTTAAAARNAKRARRGFRQANSTGSLTFGLSAIAQQSAAANTTVAAGGRSASVDFDSSSKDTSSVQTDALMIELERRIQAKHEARARAAAAEEAASRASAAGAGPSSRPLAARGHDSTITTKVARRPSVSQVPEEEDAEIEELLKQDNMLDAGSQHEEECRRMSQKVAEMELDCPAESSRVASPIPRTSGRPDEPITVTRISQQSQTRRQAITEDHLETTNLPAPDDHESCSSALVPVHRGSPTVTTRSHPVAGSPGVAQPGILTIAPILKSASVHPVGADGPAWKSRTSQAKELKSIKPDPHLIQAKPVSSDDEDDYWPDDSADRAIVEVLSQMEMPLSQSQQRQLQSQSSQPASVVGPDDEEEEVVAVSELLRAEGDAQKGGDDTSRLAKWGGLDRRNRRAAPPPQPTLRMEPTPQVRRAPPAPARTGLVQAPSLVEKSGDVRKMASVTSKPLAAHAPSASATKEIAVADLAGKAKPGTTRQKQVLSPSTNQARPRLPVGAGAATKPTCKPPHPPSSASASQPKGCKLRAAFKPPTIQHPEKARAAKEKAANTRATVYIPSKAPPLVGPDFDGIDWDDFSNDSF